LEDQSAAARLRSKALCVELAQTCADPVKIGCGVISVVRTDCYEILARITNDLPRGSDVARIEIGASIVATRGST